MATPTISLRSSDNQVFVVDRWITWMSVVLWDLSNGLPDPLNEEFPVNIQGTILQHLVNWVGMHINDVQARWDAPNNTAPGQMPVNDAAFLGGLGTLNVVNQLADAAETLDMKLLKCYCAQAIANRTRNQTPEQIRQQWGVANNFAFEPQAMIDQESEWDNVG